jgi:hypothetical protein
MPRLVVQLSQEEFDRLRDRACFELRHPRHTARLLLRGALNLPERESQRPGETETHGLTARTTEGSERASG